MSQVNLTAIIGAIAAIVLAVVQGMQGTKIADNHTLTHDRIDDVVENTVPRDVIGINQQRHDDEISAISDEQAVQDQRLDELEGGDG